MPAGVTAFQARHYYDYLDTALIISQSDSFAVTQRSPCKTLQVNWMANTNQWLWIWILTTILP